MPCQPNALCSLAVMSWQRPNIGSRVPREGHARYWERPVVKFLRATRHEQPKGDVRVESVRLPTADIGWRGPEVAFVPPAVIPYSNEHVPPYSIISSICASSVGETVR